MDGRLGIMPKEHQWTGDTEIQTEIGSQNWKNAYIHMCEQTHKGKLPLEGNKQENDWQPACHQFFVINVYQFSYSRK